MSDKELTLLMASIIRSGNENDSGCSAVDEAEKMKSYYKREYGTNISRNKDDG